MSETETRTAGFNKLRNYEEFKARHGFHPLELEWEPQECEVDIRDNRDPEQIGKRILGRKNVLRAADKATSVLQ